jgi:hypothetical protein
MTEAWDDCFADAPTNYRLRDGDTVELLACTDADGSRADCCLLPGITGLVKVARTPRIFQPEKGASLYFANVDFLVNGDVFRARIPHAALRRVK